MNIKESPSELESVVQCRSVNNQESTSVDAEPNHLGLVRRRTGGEKYPGGSCWLVERLAKLGPIHESLWQHESPT